MRKLNTDIALPIGEEICELLSYCGYGIFTQMSNHIVYEKDDVDMKFYFNNVCVTKGHRVILDFDKTHLDESGIAMILHAFNLVDLRTLPNFKSIINDTVQESIGLDNPVCGDVHKWSSGIYYPKKVENDLLEVGSQQE